MYTLFKIGAFFGFLAFLRVGSLTTKVQKLERIERLQDAGALAEKIHMMKDMMEPYVGSEIELDFYEDEGEVDLFFDNAAVLIAVDEKWALLEISDKGKKKQKLIRLSSIKGVSTKK